MSEHRFTVSVELLDELMAEHDGDSTPPPNEVDEWSFLDLCSAIDEGLVDMDLSEVELYERQGT